MKKRLIIALAFLVLFSTYKSKKLIINSKLNIEEIKIENNFILKSENIKKKLNFLYNENLIFLDLINLEEKLKKINFIESFEIKKVYPKKLKIKIYEKKPIVILQYKKKKFYISDNIEIISFIDLEYYKDLPVVFGDQENFKILYMNLKKIDFPLDLISKYYFYKSKRWDLETNKKVIIKLPPKDYIISLKNFMNLRNEISFDKYKIFDYRIKDQLILK